MTTLTTISEIQTVPLASKFIRFTGQVIEIKQSEKKTTAVMKCKGGELVAITAFGNENELFCNGCGVGKVIQFGGLRAQAFNKSRFDGQSFFGTPLEFELIFNAYSSIAVLENPSSKEVYGFEEIKPGSELYVLKCILTGPLQKAGPQLYGCEVVDLKGFRADLLIKSKDLKEELRAAKKWNQMILDGCMATISGDCLSLHLDSESKLKLVDKKVYKMAEILKTPVKRKSNDGTGGETPKK